MRMEPLCSGETSGELVLVSVCLVDSHAFSQEHRPRHSCDCATLQPLVQNDDLPW